MSASWASTTQLLSQAPPFSHMLDIANQGPWWAEWRALVVPSVSGWACAFKKTQTTKPGFKGDFYKSESLKCNLLSVLYRVVDPNN